MNIFAVYSPVIYSIEVSQINLQQKPTLNGDPIVEDDNAGGLNDGKHAITTLFNYYFASDYDEASCGYVKGQLLVEYEGIRGFMPVSQLSAEHYPRVGSADKDEILQKRRLRFVYIYG